MDREAIEAAFWALDDELVRRGVLEAKLWACGGVVMVLEIGSRDSTGDVDAAVWPRQEVLEASKAIAGRLGLREDWLNDKASAFYPDHADQFWRQPRRRYGGVEVHLADDRMMLALKLRAGRGRLDRPDVVVLLDRLGISEPEQALAIFAALYPNDALSETGWATLESALAILQRRRQVPDVDADE